MPQQARYILGLATYLATGVAPFSPGHAPKVIDHSVGMYMHDHPDFPVKKGGE